MSYKRKTKRNSEFYKTYEEFLIDYIRYKEEEERKAEEISQQNKRDVEYLRWKLLFK